MSSTIENTQVNGLDVDALTQAIEAIADDPAKGQTRWQVTSRWRGGTRSDTSVKAYYIGGQRVAKDFTIRIDEPYELCGTNQFANPQEFLLAALNACMIVGYSAVCALQGIELTELRIETEGDIDLRGVLEASIPR
jgi:organic hydroperoxide reductase OsmC/OhrA